jgi:hypothetical protein
MHSVESIQALLNEKKAIEIQGLPEATYHEFPAMSASGLKEFRKSPGDWKYRRENPSGDSIARKWGRLVHIFLSEPHRLDSAIAQIEGNRNSTKVRDEIEAAEASGKMVIKPEDFRRAVAVADYCRAHPIVGLALKRGLGERSLFWIDPATGAPCKARIDWMTNDIIFDWKTFDNVHSDETIERQIRKMFYDYQHAWYVEGFFQVFGIRPQFHHVFIQEEPIKVQITQIVQASIEEITPYIRQHVEDFARCLKADHWPLNDDNIKDIVMKEWRD